MTSNKCKKVISSALIGISALMISAPSHAGLVWFSRANCANNESISWDWPGNNRWLWTNSWHNKNGVWQEPIRTGWEYTYRSAAVHRGEGFPGGWYVVGQHYQWTSTYGEYQFGYTPTRTCNLQYFFPYW